MSLGPGSLEHLTFRAREAIAQAQVVVGYQTYLALIRPLLTGKEVAASAMKQEVKRCRLAIERARQGARVALVSSGDAGIYGMAGLVLEICAAQNLIPAPPDKAAEADLHLEIIPGVPALAAGAALLGAPLMHDFCAISLSDLLTPWELIVQRLEAAAQADFVIVLYNPKSKKRAWQLAKAQEILLTIRPPQTPVGIVRRAMREGEAVILTTLKDLPASQVDMQTIVIVGNSQSFVFGDYLITPRGYGEKYALAEEEAATP